jgi:hypothetical protein
MSILITKNKFGAYEAVVVSASGGILHPGRAAQTLDNIFNWLKENKGSFDPSRS